MEEGITRFVSTYDGLLYSNPWKNVYLDEFTIVGHLSYGMKIATFDVPDYEEMYMIILEEQPVYILKRYVSDELPEDAVETEPKILSDAPVPTATPTPVVTLPPTPTPRVIQLPFIPIN